MLVLAVVSATGLILVDRLTKVAVARWLAPASVRVLAPGVRLAHIRHRLRAWNVRRQRVGLVALFAGTIATIAWLASVGLFFGSPLAAVGLGLAVAGASSNLWDRLHDHRFVDFICVGRWPAFNVADAGVCVGAVLALWHLT